MIVIGVRMKPFRGAFPFFLRQQAVGVRQGGEAPLTAPNVAGGVGGGLERPDYDKNWFAVGKSSSDKQSFTHPIPSQISPKNA